MILSIPDRRTCGSKQHGKNKPRLWLRYLQRYWGAPQLWISWGVARM